MPETAMSLDELWQLAWDSLRQGSSQSRSSFHQGVLATQSEQGPEARYVVLRQVDEQNSRVCFHTDTRSPKVQQIKNEPTIACAFMGKAYSCDCRALRNCIKTIRSHVMAGSKRA